MAKRVSARRVRKHRHYTYETAADVLDVSVQTVRAWKAEGLTVLADRKPHYILGEALIEFLTRRHKNRSVIMAADQFYCFTCRAPHKPFGMMVDYVSISATRGRLVALCEACERPCHRFVSASSLGELRQIFEIATSNTAQA